MFPPLCLPAVTDTVDVSYGTAAEPLISDQCRLAHFTPEESRVIEESNNVEVRFALFEWIRGWFC